MRSTPSLYFWPPTKKNSPCFAVTSRPGNTCEPPPSGILQRRGELDADPEQAEADHGDTVIVVAFVLDEVGKCSEEKADPDRPYLPVRASRGGKSEQQRQRKINQERLRKTAPQQDQHRRVRQGRIVRNQLAEDEEERAERVLRQQEGKQDRKRSSEARERPEQKPKRRAASAAQREIREQQKTDDQRHDRRLD